MNAGITYHICTVQSNGIEVSKNCTIHVFSRALASMQGREFVKTVPNISVFEIPDMVARPYSDLRGITFPRTEKPFFTSISHPGHLLPSRYCFKLLEAHLMALSGETDREVDAILQHPCQDANASFACCDIDTVLSRDRGTVMQVMRFATHRGRGRYDLDQIVEASQWLGLRAFSPGQGPMITDRKFLPFGLDKFAMIPICQFRHQSKHSVQRYVIGGRDDFSCDLFQPAVTDNGICHAFNTPGIGRLFQNSSFTHLFSKVYRKDVMENPSMHVAQPFSRDLGLTFYLDRQTLFRNFLHDAPEYISGNFDIAFSNPMQSVTIRSRLRPVHIGSHVIFLLTPVVLASTRSLEELHLSQRKCLFHHEKVRIVEQETSVLTDYSQRGCVFECMLKQASKTCLCTPWDMPYPTSSIYKKICNAYGYYCFEEVMKNTSYESHGCGHCLPDCDVVEYQVSEIVRPIPVQQLCRARNVLICCMNF